VAVSGIEAGIARANITPPLSAPHAGWGAQTHLYADGVDHDLFATVLALRSGEAMVIMVELDLVIVSREESDAIRQAVSGITGVAVEAIRVGVTHNHAGPPPSAWNWMPEGREALQTYYSLLPSLVSGAAYVAVGSLRPARIGFNIGQSHTAVNRRETAPNGQTVTGVNPAGEIDPDLLVVRIDGEDGEPIASIVGYTMHPTTLGPGNRLMSPDWPGHLKRVMSNLTGAPCLFVQGATGDIGPGPDGFSSDAESARRLGAILGSQAGALYFSTDVENRQYEHERIWDSGAPLGKWNYRLTESEPTTLLARSTEIELPVIEQPSKQSAREAVESAQSRLTSLIESSAPVSEIEDATFAVKRANMTMSRAETFGEREHFPVALHVIRIGPLVIAGCEGEPFSQIARDIKAASPFQFTWFGGYTGGWFGYVPTPEEYQLGGYEVDTSPYTSDAAGILTRGVIDFLNQLS
jgi:hypothetical protein